MLLRCTRLNTSLRRRQVGRHQLCDLTVVHFEAKAGGFIFCTLRGVVKAFSKISTGRIYIQVFSIALRSI